MSEDTTEPRDGWLYAELQRASEDYAAIPEHLRPVVTTPRPGPPVPAAERDEARQQVADLRGRIARLRDAAEASAIAPDELVARLNAALAGSGEPSPQEIVDADRVYSVENGDYDDRPAPVVHNHGTEDGPGLACPETRLPDGTLRGACVAPVVPDSADVRSLTDLIETAMTDDGHRMPRDAETRYLAHVAAQAALAVVGQGVTAGCCDPSKVETRIEGTWLVDAHPHHTCGTGESGHYGAHEPGCGLVPVVDLRGLPGWDDLRAAMRSGEQGREA